MRRRRYRRATRTRRTGRRRTFGRPLRRRQRGFIQTAGFYGRFNPATNPLAFQKNASKELKFFDTPENGAVISNTPQIIDASLNLISQGTGESQRIGRNIVIKKIMFKGVIHLAEQAGVADPGFRATELGHDLYRIIVYLDKQTNGIGATAPDILESVIAGESIHSFRNLANSKRFVILFDKRFNINTTTMSGNSDVANQKTMRITKPLEYYINVNLPVEFENVTGVLSGIASNNIGVLAVSLDGRVSITGQYRIRYYG